MRLLTLDVEILVSLITWIKWMRKRDKFNGQKLRPIFYLKNCLTFKLCLKNQSRFLLNLSRLILSIIIKIYIHHGIIVLKSLKSWKISYDWCQSNASTDVTKSGHNFISNTKMSVKYLKSISINHFLVQSLKSQASNLLYWQWRRKI